MSKQWGGVCKILLLLLILAFSSYHTNAQPSGTPTLCNQFGQNFTPDITITSGTLSSSLGVSGWTGKKVLINGTFEINSNFMIHSCIVTFGSGGAIKIDPGITFESYFSKYFRCTATWNGFVLTGGTTKFFFNQVEDALNAFDFQNSSAAATIVGNNFDRNRVGINASGVTMNAIIAGNQFNSTGHVNGTFQYSFAGVQLTNCPAATIGLNLPVEGYRNIFNRQRYGVKTTNSTATVGLSKFYRNTWGVHAQRSELIVRGATTGLRSNFGKNINDVVTTQTHMDLFNCFMDSCSKTNISSTLNDNLQIVNIHDNIIRVTNYPDPSNEKFAIVMDRPQMGTETFVRAAIDRNQISIMEFGNRKRGGIDVTGATHIKDVMRIDSNYVFVEPGGTNGFPTNYLAIKINGADNYKVTRNTMETDNTYEDGSSRWGAFLINGDMIKSEGNAFWFNHIAGIGEHHDNGCCAVHAQSAGAWSICTNTTDKTFRGFHFMGTCGESKFGLNTIVDHHVTASNLTSTGLLIQGLGGDNGYLGDQVCQQNYWTLTDYPGPNAITAALFGNDQDQPSFNTRSYNEFKVDDINDPHQAPEDRTPSGTQWFKGVNCPEEPTSCVLQNNDHFNERDEWIKNAYPTPGSSPDVNEWQDTRSLLAKMMRYPAIVTGDYAAFRNAYANSSAEGYARYDSLFRTSVASVSAQTSINNLTNQIQTKQTELSVLESGITDLTLLSPLFWNSRTVIMNDLTTLNNQKNLELANVSMQRELVLQSCELLNASLPSAQLYEQNQKTLNALSIKKARGIAFSETDSLTLHAIAGQCLEDAGVTKFEAASLLPPEVGGQYYRENPLDYECPQYRSKQNPAAALGISIAPNPVSDRLQVNFTETFTGTCLIYDLTGKLRVEHNIQSPGLSASLSVSNLTPGVYFLTVTDASGLQAERIKFIISR